MGVVGGGLLFPHVPASAPGCAGKQTMLVFESPSPVSPCAWWETLPPCAHLRRSLPVHASPLTAATLVFQKRPFGVIGLFTSLMMQG